MDDLRICDIDGCASKHASLGMCAKHYKAHQRKRGMKRISDRACSKDGCGRDHMAKGLCKLHYNDLMPISPYRYNPNRKRGCLFEDCHRHHYLEGVCARHYRGGRVDPPYRSKAGGDFREHNLLYKYGITRMERDMLFVAQDGLCSICRDAEAAHIDHDHNHGCSDDPKRGCRDCVRGGLCARCNWMLGAHEAGRSPDDAWWCARANFYLRARPFSGTQRKQAA